MKLKDKIAIVTGGTSGIGLAIARLFMREGAKVVLASTGSNGEDVGRSLGKDCLFIKTDVRKSKEVNSLVSKTIRKFGSIDILVNSAGVYTLPQDGILQISEDSFDETMGVNVKGIFLTTKYCIPELLKVKGNIINIASILGLKPEKESAVYSASKSAVIMLTKTVALEFAGRGVRVNAVCPGPINTPMLRRGWPEERDFKKYVSETLKGRIGAPEEVAELALFLGSNDSSYITGAAYVIDGGESLR